MVTNSMFQPIIESVEILCGQITAVAEHLNQREKNELFNLLVPVLAATSTILEKPEGYAIYNIYPDAIFGKVQMKHD